MFNLIKQFFLSLLPIVRQAALEIASDTVNQMAYPTGRRRRVGVTRYNRYEGVGNRIRSDYKDDSKLYGVNRDGSGRFGQLSTFHDVLLVAFDISGPTRTDVEEFLYKNLPVSGDAGVGKVSIDTYWIADDDSRDSDCDSAVFVTKGKQAEARELLIKHGLLD